MFNLTRYVYKKSLSASVISIKSYKLLYKFWDIQ
jgi:hypothetical protein